MKKQDKNSGHSVDCLCLACCHPKVAKAELQPEDIKKDCPVDSAPHPKWVTQEDTFVKVEEANVLVNLVKNYQILFESYVSLSKAYVDLKALFDRHEEIISSDVASKLTLNNVAPGGFLG